jgi:hypothetical protein
MDQKIASTGVCRSFVSLRTTWMPAFIEITSAAASPVYPRNR